MVALLAAVGADVGLALALALGDGEADAPADARGLGDADAGAVGWLPLTTGGATGDDDVCAPLHAATNASVQYALRASGRINESRLT